VFTVGHRKRRFDALRNAFACDCAANLKNSARTKKKVLLGEVECVESIAMSERLFPDLEAASFISKHSLAFLLPKQGSPGGVQLKASGSLVTFDQRYFVLTATHVWAALQKSSTIHYSAISEITHDVVLRKEALKAYSLDDDLERALVAGEDLKETDADLTLLELHAADYRNMQVRLSFFSLAREPHAKIDDCVIIGAPGVLAQSDAKEINTMYFELRAIFVQALTHEAEHDGLDFLSGLPYQDASSPIQNYQGMSGGGLWSVSYFPGKPAGERYDVFLIGVIFWQDNGKIRCLGRKAIQRLVQKVRQTPHS
jgi:hypothetical protein